MRSSETSTLSEVKFRRLRRHQSDQPIEDDLQHRQPLVGDHRRVDDRSDAGIVIQRNVGKAEAEQRIDFFLRQDALGAAFCRLNVLTVVDHGSPMCRHRLGAAFTLRRCGRRLFRGRGFLLGLCGYAPFGSQCVLVGLIFIRHCPDRFFPTSLNDDFLEQHGVDPAGRNGSVDAPGQFLLESV